MKAKRWLIPATATLLAAALFAGQGLRVSPTAHARPAPVSANVHHKGDVNILPRPITSQPSARGIQPAASAPAYTTSYYESTTAYTTLQNQGCTAARGPAGIVVLDFGEPAYSGGVYGTNDFGGHFDSDDAIFHAAANFIYGAWNCRTSSTNIAVAVGTSNYGGWMGGYSSSSWYAAGQAWGQMVNNAQNYSVSNGYNNLIGVYGADDIEVEWANFTLTSNFVNGYNAASTRLFFDYGDDSGGTSPSPWTAYDVWYVAWGAADSYPLPEIYYNADAVYDWEPLNVWACNNEGGPMYFKGVMSEYPTGNTPSQAWYDMYNALGTNSCTAQTQSALIFSTNI